MAFISFFIGLIPFLFIEGAVLTSVKQNYPVYTIDMRIGAGQIHKRCFKFSYPTAYGNGAERTVMLCVLLSEEDIAASQATGKRLNQIYRYTNTELNIPPTANELEKRRRKWLTAYKIARARESQNIQKLRDGLKTVFQQEKIPEYGWYLFLTKFVQAIEYSIPPKDENNWGFYAPVTVLYKKTGDCDSKALLLAMLLRGLGAKDTMLLVSFQYGHAMLGIKEFYVRNYKKGPYYKPFKNAKYYFIETTSSNMGFGQLSTSQRDILKWEVYDPTEFELWE